MKSASLIATFVLFLLPSFTYAQVELTIPAQITFGTLDSSYQMLRRFGHQRAIWPAESTNQIFIESIIVTITPIDDERIRVTFPQPIHITMAPDASLPDTVEKVFRSIILKVQPGLVEKLVSLKDSKYIAAYDNALEEMTNFTQYARDFGSDSAIKKFANMVYTPPLLIVRNIGFFVDMKSVGSVDGVSVGHFHLFAQAMTLPTHKINSEGFNDGHVMQLGRLHRLIDASDDVLQTYLGTMQNLKDRIAYLEAHGWLDGLWHSHNEVNPSTLSKFDDIIPIEPRVACHAIF